MQALSNTTSAVIVVPPLSGDALASVCRRFSKHEYNVPVLVACGPDSEKSQKKLYDLGVAAVFVWPVDRAALLRTVFRISRRTRPSRKKKSSQEIALEELVSSHLRTEASVIGRKLRVRVIKRFVMLCGHVDALWQVKVAENIAAEVPGVEDVFSDAVLVSGDPDLSDRGIANAVRQVLKHTAGADASTLAVSVKTGVVTLAGSVSNRSELDRVVKLISHTRGVVKIEDWAVVTAKGHRKDHQVVKTVREAVALRFPKGKIDVAVFGGIAVVSGKVRSSVERRDMELLVSRQPGVQRVVDKLRVAGAGRGN
jgi:osmotically-inducible protein OsmY